MIMSQSQNKVEFYLLFIIYLHEFYTLIFYPSYEPLLYVNILSLGESINFD